MSFVGIGQTPNVNTPSVQTGATALAANPNRVGWIIQNVGTAPLFVCLGGTASSSEYNFILKGGSVAADGNGGSYSQNEGTIFTGKVTIYSTGASYTVTEFE